MHICDIPYLKGICQSMANVSADRTAQAHSLDCSRNDMGRYRAVRADIVLDKISLIIRIKYQIILYHPKIKLWYILVAAENIENPVPKGIAI